MIAGLALLYAATAFAAPAQPDTRAQPLQLAAKAEPKPLVKRPAGHMCYDPPRRAACKERCDAARAQCATNPSACDEQAANCASACPPKVCSRGAAPP
jgi:hypothetical protein